MEPQVSGQGEDASRGLGAVAPGQREEMASTLAENWEVGILWRMNGGLIGIVTLW